MRKRLMVAPLALGAVLAIGGVAAPAQAVADVGSGSVATPAGAAAACALVWNDKYTAGISCDYGPFKGWARCSNGAVAFGTRAAAGATSYAYCSQYGTTLKQNPVEWGTSAA
ncbi:hypothetical protein ACH4T9_29795 [Micromonospora sp. NPDC020750]|uniref:hypothetical protein n=1 Tax=unclassified Micromonospora TaxID=2617518 RepID=UPI00379B5E74